MQLQETSPSFITSRTLRPVPPPSVIQKLLLTTDLFIGFTQCRHKHTHMETPCCSPSPPECIVFNTAGLRPPRIQLSTEPRQSSQINLPLPPLHCPLVLKLIRLTSRLGLYCRHLSILSRSDWAVKVCWVSILPAIFVLRFIPFPPRSCVNL